MTHDTDNSCHLLTLPTEILLYIFTFLPAKQLTKCRQVCVRCKETVDGFARSESLWQKYSKNEFKDIYKIARQKCLRSLPWYNLYRSLSLWSKLNHAKVLRDEFASAISICDEIRSFEVLQDGIIGVHTKAAIVYYDTETFERSKRDSLNGDYSRYAENDDVLILSDFHFHLYIVRKVFYPSERKIHVAFDNVKIFMLLDHKIYFITLDDDIYQCNFDNDNLHAEYIKKCPDGILSLGYKNKMLHILTYERNIYILNGNNLIFECMLGPNSNMLNILQKYDLLDQLDWRIYFQWMFVLHHTVPEGPLRDIVTVRAYDHVYFVGSNWGVLRIYYAPYSGGEFDLFNAEPIQQFNFMERKDCPVLSMCPILMIDVLEEIDGHIVLIAMPKKIAVLKFKHNFMRMTSSALLPLSEVLQIRELKFDECVGNTRSLDT